MTGYTRPAANGRRAELVGCIHGLVSRFRVLSGQRRGEMAARGEAERADLVRIDAVAGGLRANDAHGALRVLERNVGAVLPTFAWKPIRQHENRHTLRGHARRELGTFVRGGDEPVRAARYHQQGVTIRALGAEDAQVRRGHIPQEHRRPVGRQRLGV